MKKKIMFACVIAIAFVSCKKDMSKPNLTDSSMNAVTKSGLTDPENLQNVIALAQSVHKEDGMLKFQSEEHFLYVQEQLRQTQEKWDDAFVSAFSHLNDEELNDMEELLEFNSNLPFELFEKTLGFSSLRKKIEGEIILWLENDNLDWDNNPDNHWVSRLETRTLLNEQGEVMVGKSIFLMRDEAYAEIIDGNMETLNVIRDMSNITDAVYKNVNIIDEIYWQVGPPGSGIKIGPGPSGPDDGPLGPCKSRSWRQISVYRTSGDYRIQATLNLRVFPLSCGPLAKTISYKKRRRNGWRRYRTDITAHVVADMIDDTDECTKTKVYNEKSGRKRRIDTGRPGSMCKAASGDVYGNYLGNGMSTSLNLKW